MYDSLTDKVRIVVHTGSVNCYTCWTCYYYYYVHMYYMFVELDTNAENVKVTKQHNGNFTR